MVESVEYISHIFTHLSSTYNVVDNILGIGSRMNIKETTFFFFFLTMQGKTRNRNCINKPGHF